MRDLDQIQERDGDDRGRKLGTVLLATGSVVGLTFAMGVVVGRAAEPAEPEAKDPLEQLAPSAEVQALQPADGEQAVAPSAPEAPEVKPTELSFPGTLTEKEDRPEVLAALRAAALEEAALAEPTAAPVPAAQAVRAAPSPTMPAAVGGITIAGAAVGQQPFHQPMAQPADPQELIAAVPAAVAAGNAGRALHQAARHDPMVAEAIRTDEARAPRAARGHDGEYTLQVISYDSAEPANAFAEGLRAKGHEAFVVKADIPERGRFYRVRVGPFKNRHKAEVYRREFEQDERMNTFVVRKKPEA